MDQKQIKKLLDDKNLKEIYELENCNLAYKLLMVVRDQGMKKEATEFLIDLLEASDLRYDDDQIDQSICHLEIAIMYLEEQFGLDYDESTVERYVYLALRIHPISVLEKNGLTVHRNIAKELNSSRLDLFKKAIRDAEEKLATLGPNWTSIF